MEQAESVAVEAPKLEPERLQGLLTYLVGSVDRSFTATEPAVHEFREAIANDNNMSERDKALCAFRLGYINGLAHAVHIAEFNSAAEELLDKPENVARFLSAMAKLLRLYGEYNAGEKKGWLDVYDGLIGVSNELEEFMRDMVRQLKVQE